MNWTNDGASSALPLIQVDGSGNPALLALVIAMAESKSRSAAWFTT